LPTPEEAKILGVGVSQALLRVDRFLHFPTAKNAVFAQMLCRTDRYSFSQTIGGQAAPVT
jgi:GntR family transcriptional regulator